MKNQKGITLVALVVTIVVLLILAGVTIMYVLSDDGIFSRAESANTQTNEAAAKEAVLYAILSVQTAIADPDTDITTTTAETEFKSAIPSGMNATVTFGNVTLSGLSITSGSIEDAGKVTHTFTYDTTNGLVWTSGNA